MIFKIFFLRKETQDNFVLTAVEVDDPELIKPTMDSLRTHLDFDRFVPGSNEQILGFVHQLREVANKLFDELQ